MQFELPAPGEWTEACEARLAALLKAEYDGESLDGYIRRVSPRHLPPRHIAPIIDLFERSRRGRVLACVEMPPRTAKTTTMMHGLGWRLLRDPSLVNGFATFGDGYATSRSRITRALTRAGGVKLSKEMANLHEWRTEHGGGCLFRGYDGEWTGQGINGVAIVDDPFKNRATAESKKIRENVWDFLTDVYWTRLEDDASMIVTHTRWHPDDLIGRLLSGKFAGHKFEEIRLPAICEDEDDILGRNIGESIWPERKMFSIEELRKTEASIGPYTWASLFQQRPRARGANVFEKDPQRFQLATWKATDHRVILCCDPAATDDNYADFSAAFVLAASGFGDDMKVWILHGWRDRVTVPQVVRKLLELQKRHWNAPVCVEAVGGFKAVPQMMKEIEKTLRIRPVKPVGDKFTRAQALAAAWNTGRVFVPLDGDLVWEPSKRRFAPRTPGSLRPGLEKHIQWTDELLNEAESFTGVEDPEDDQIDALAHGFNELHGANVKPRGQQRNGMPFG